MDNELPAPWIEAIGRLDFAYQPIVDAAGEPYGYEALLRGTVEAGFGSIAQLFDCAYYDRVLYALDLRLRAKAFAKFAAAFLPGRARLFYNIDNRLLSMPDYSPGNTRALARSLGVDPAAIVFEISERHEFDRGEAAWAAIEAYREQGFGIALDDYGAGYSGLKLLYRARPDLVKIDRFFIEGCGADPRKRLFVRDIVRLARAAGRLVVAEGAEAAADLEACADMGCDLFQGYAIARPALDPRALPARFPPPSARVERRARGAERVEVESRIERVPALAVDAPLAAALARFRSGREDFIPVAGPRGEVAGAYLEKDFRTFAYSPFGISLLHNLEANGGKGGLLRALPAAERGRGVEDLIELYAAYPGAEAILVSEGGRYAGALPAKALLEVMNARELRDARDQNPLSRLPGNRKTARALAGALAAARGKLVVYFDFNDFKPYNDAYGFRQGDRVILLFAGILRERFGRAGAFAGHLGGDDFIAVADAGPAAEAAVADCLDRFARGAVAFYSAADRARGAMRGKDREGQERDFPLLSACAALIEVGGAPRRGARGDMEALARTAAALKAAAKRTPGGVAKGSFRRT